MATITTGREELCPTLDPHLFTFKPQLNQKSSEIAQNLLTDFYDRQLKHVKRLQEFVSVDKNENNLGYYFYINRKK